MKNIDYSNNEIENDPTIMKIIKFRVSLLNALLTCPLCNLIPIKSDEYTYLHNCYFLLGELPLVSHLDFLINKCDKLHLISIVENFELDYIIEENEIMKDTFNVIFNEIYNTPNKISYNNTIVNDNFSTNISLSKWAKYWLYNFLIYENSKSITSLRDNDNKFKAVKKDNYFEGNNINYYHYPMEDFGCVNWKNLLNGVKIILKNLNNQLNKQIIYVHCKAGKGRSAAFIIILLMYIFNYTPKKALEYVKFYRNCIKVIYEKLVDITCAFLFINDCDPQLIDIINKNTFIDSKNNILPNTIYSTIINSFNYSNEDYNIILNTLKELLKNKNNIAIESWNVKLDLWYTFHNCILIIDNNNNEIVLFDNDIIPIIDITIIECDNFIELNGINKLNNNEIKLRYQFIHKII